MARIKRVKHADIPDISYDDEGGRKVLYQLEHLLQEMEDRDRKGIPVNEEVRQAVIGLKGKLEAAMAQKWARDEEQASALRSALERWKA